MSSEIHVGDIGTELRATIYDGDTIVDLSSSTELLFFLKKPDGTISQLIADLYTDGTDGIIRYIVVDGDFDQVGQYKLQARVSVDGGTYNSSIASFKVHHNVEH